MKILLSSALLIFFSVAAFSQPGIPAPKYMSYKGLVMAGYQGWFNAAGDGADRGWNHYTSDGIFGPCCP